MNVRVTPSAKADSLEYIDGVLKAKVTAPPEKGKANRALLKLLKPCFGACEIVAGHRSRRKTVLVRDNDMGSVESVLEGLAASGE